MKGFKDFFVKRDYEMFNEIMREKMEKHAKETGGELYHFRHDASERDFVESDIFTCRYSSPPGGMDFFAQNGKRLYEEAGGDGVNPVIHPDYPKHFIYPSGKGWSFIEEDKGSRIRLVVADLEYAKAHNDKARMLECKKELEELGINFFKWDI